MSYAVMQPYLFPYIGYYQLAFAADKFVFFDDVNYRNRSYINRNFILAKDQPQRFVLPILLASQNKLINQLSFIGKDKKLLKSIEYNYRSAPSFKNVFPIIEEVLTSPDRNVANLCARSITRVFEYLDIKKEWLFASSLQYERDVDADCKLVSIGRSLNQTEYINSIGGKKIYCKRKFQSYGMSLFFLETNSIKYSQPSAAFVPSLSMLDVLMRNERKAIKEFLGQYSLS